MRMLIRLSEMYPEDLLTKYNLAQFYVTFELFPAAVLMYNELQAALPNSIEVNFAAAFCSDLEAKEDDADKYLDLIASNPKIKQSYFHLVLLYLKRGNHEAAQKIIDLYVLLFNDFEGRALLTMWVAYNHINFQNTDKMLIYQKRLEYIKDDPLVHDFYQLNKAIIGVNYNATPEESEFMLENLYNETTNQNVKLIAGINLLAQLEGRGQPRFRISFLKRLIDDFKDKIECSDLQARYKKYREEMFETDSDFIFEAEFARGKGSGRLDRQLRQLLAFPVNAVDSRSGERISLQNSEHESASGLPPSKLLSVMQLESSESEDEQIDLTDIVDNCYFRYAVEAIEESTDPGALRSQMPFENHGLTGASSSRITSSQNGDLTTPPLAFTATDPDELYKLAIQFLNRNDVPSLKSALLHINHRFPTYKEEIVTFALGTLTRSNFLR